MEILEKYEEQIIALQNKLDLMSNKTTSDEFTAVMARLKDLQDLYDKETNRQLAEAKVEQEALKLRQEDERLNLEAEKIQQNAAIEEKKLKAGKWSTAKQIGVKVVGALAVIAGNGFLLFEKARLENSEVCLTSFEQKILNIDKIKW